MGLVLITILIPLFIISLFTYVIVPHFVAYYINECKDIYQNFKTKNSNLAEVLTVVIFSLLTGVCVFIFYKSVQSFCAYLLSYDLIDFFIKTRGVFSFSGTEGQNPFNLLNVLYGLFLNTLNQILCVFILVEITKRFMLTINKLFGDNIFSSTSLVFFSTIGVLVFIILDIIFYLQSVAVLKTVTNVVLLVGGKLAFLLMIFSIWHIQLLNNVDYTKSLLSEFKINSYEKILITKPKTLLLFTYFVSIILNLPLFLGLQWSKNEFIVLGSLIVGLGIFYFVLKYTLLNGYNFVGIYLLKENRDQNLPNNIEEKLTLSSKAKRIALILYVLILVLLSISGFVFYFFYTVVFLVSAVIIICTTYIVASVLNNAEVIWNICYGFIYSMLSSFFPLLMIMLFIITVFSRWPHRVNTKVFNNYQTALVDTAGNLLYKEPIKINNPSIAMSYEEIPDFLLKVLLLKEDRCFFDQKNIFFNRSNWHGTSVSFLRGRGGSSINNQLVKNLAFNGFFPREIQRKHSETLASYQLSMSEDLEIILANYINNISFNGGRGFKGIINSSFYTFGKNTNQLNELQMLYLVFTLHRGTKFKTQSNYIPYKDIHNYSLEVKNQLLVYAENWYRQGYLTKSEITKMRVQNLDFKNENYKCKNISSKNNFFKRQIPYDEIEGKVYTSTMSKNMDLKMVAAVDKFYNYFKNKRYKNGAQLFSSALAVNVKTGEIIAHYGGNSVEDLTSFGEGYPVGSLIKPFILLELLEKGHKVRLFDGKRKNKKIANNHNGQNSNEYKNVAEILKKSLNSPFGNLDEIIPIVPLFKSVEEKFANININPDLAIDLDDNSLYTWNRINYPLGSRRMKLIDIAQAYQTLFNNGDFIKLHSFKYAMNPYTYEIEQVKIQNKNIYKDKNTRVIHEALAKVLTPGGTAHSLNKILTQGEYMSKTGTSDKYKHGLTVLSDGNILVVAWVSYGKNINGQLRLGLEPIPNQSGGGSAGKLAAFIMKEINNSDVH